MGKGKVGAVVVITGNQSGNDAILEPSRIGADFMLHCRMFCHAIGRVRSGPQQENQVRFNQPNCVSVT
jgi:hypothetical protein